MFQHYMTPIYHHNEGVVQYWIKVAYGLPFAVEIFSL